MSSKHLRLDNIFSFCFGLAFTLAISVLHPVSQLRTFNYKLSSSHLHPDSSEKMRNHLAEQVLDDNMLNLMKQYQLSLINNEVLNGAIEFLENTSKPLLNTAFRNFFMLFDIS
jgi:hypothetical protein